MIGEKQDVDERVYTVIRDRFLMGGEVFERDLFVCRSEDAARLRKSYPDRQSHVLDDLDVAVFIEPAKRPEAKPAIQADPAETAVEAMRRFGRQLLDWLEPRIDVDLDYLDVSLCGDGVDMEVGYLTDRPGGPRFSIEIRPLAEGGAR